MALRRRQGGMGRSSTFKEDPLEDGDRAAPPSSSLAAQAIMASTSHRDSSHSAVHPHSGFKGHEKTFFIAAMQYDKVLEKVGAKIIVAPILSNPDIDPLESSRKVDDYYMDIVGGVKKRRIYGLGYLGSSQTSIGMTYVDVERIRAEALAEGRAEVQQVLDDVVARQTQMEETIRTLMARFNASDSNLLRVP